MRKAITATSERTLLSKESSPVQLTASQWRHRPKCTRKDYKVNAVCSRCLNWPVDICITLKTSKALPYVSLELSALGNPSPAAILNCDDIRTSMKSQQLYTKSTGAKSCSLVPEKPADEIAYVPSTGYVRFGSDRHHQNSNDSIPYYDDTAIEREREREKWMIVSASLRVVLSEMTSQHIHFAALSNMATPLSLSSPFLSLSVCL